MEREFMLSSFLLLAPGFLAFYYGKLVLGLVSLTAFLASFNYWTYPGHYSLMVDKLTAFTSGLIYTYFAIRALPGTGFLMNVIAWSLLSACVIMYYVSVEFSRRRHRMWMIAHGLFHFVVGCSQTFVILL
jgi:uncharacterized membrane protein HdeD (DUF308 family)